MIILEEIQRSCTLLNFVQVLRVKRYTEPTLEKPTGPARPDPLPTLLPIWEPTHGSAPRVLSLEAQIVNGALALEFRPDPGSSSVSQYI